MNKQFLKIIKLALEEDIGKKDLTSSLISRNIWTKAKIICRKRTVVCGISFVNEIFHQVDPKIKIRWLVKDKDIVLANKVLCSLEGPARSLLTGERTALNFLQTLSGTATITNRFVTKLKGTKVKLLDTRKTLPGLRLAQKYAVRCGGGYNHRFGLYDGVLIKENHIISSGSIKNALTEAKRLYPKKTIEIEVRDLKELQEALDAKARMIMLDNFSLKNIKEAVRINRGRAKLEVSGGVNLKNIGSLAKTGVDYISVGKITKSLVPADLSMVFTLSKKRKNDR